MNRMWRLIIVVFAIVGVGIFFQNCSPSTFQGVTGSDIIDSFASKSGCEDSNRPEAQQILRGLYDAEVVFPKPRPAFMILSGPVPASNIYR